MINNVSSNIKNISKVTYKEKPFEYWGPTPAEARKAVVNKPHGLRDKRTTMKEAVDRHIKDGMNLCIGGFVNTRVPTAIIHEIVRKGVKDLTISIQSMSICCELLAGAMILDPDRVSIRRVELAWWGYEIIGIAPLFRHLVTNGIIEVDDYTNYGMSVRFKAASMGIPFVPIRDHGGSDMELVNRGKMIECPFTKENVYIVPSCIPDVALINSTMADKFGNARLFGALCTDPEMATAANHVIMTTEKVIPSEAIRTYPNLTEIPYAAVDCLVEQPFASHPGAVYGNYWFDMDHIRMFRNAGEEFRKTGSKEALQKYYDEYVFGVADHNEFLEKIGFRTLQKLRDWDGHQPVIAY